MKTAAHQKNLPDADSGSSVQEPCNICGSTVRQPYCEENGLNLVRCNQCGFVYVYPQPFWRSLHELYDESYFRNSNSSSVGYTDYIADEENIRRTARGRLNHLHRYVHPRRLLDVGCAAGFFLDEARAAGWQVTGVDISAFGVEFARERFSLDVHQGDLCDLNLPLNEFDLVTMWDVIEHVPDPAANIQRAAQLLRPGGYLTIATPDVYSVPARLTGHRWVGYKLSHEHLSYFSRSTLTMLLEAAGFEIVSCRHVGKHVPFQLFCDRLTLYLPRMARGLQLAMRALGASNWSLYINPMDIIQVTARLRNHRAAST